MFSQTPSFDAESTVFNEDMDFESMEQSEADKRLRAIFFRGTVKNEVKSATQGRPIFDDIIMVRIISPGTRDDFIGDATDEYKQRFPKQWLQFKRGLEQLGDGTPLSQLAWLTPGQVAEFNAFHIYTVEQLAGMPDAVSQRFQAHHQIKQRAQAYIDAANSRAPMQMLEARLAERDEANRLQAETIAALTKQVAELAAKIKD